MPHRPGPRRLCSFKFGEGSAALALYAREALAVEASVSTEGSGFTAVTLKCIVSSCGKVDEVMARAEKARATMVKRAQKAKWGVYFGHFSDPDGHL